MRNYRKKQVLKTGIISDIETGCLEIILKELIALRDILKTNKACFIPDSNNSNRFYLYSPYNCLGFEVKELTFLERWYCIRLMEEKKQCYANLLKLNIKLHGTENYKRLKNPFDE